MRKWIVLLAAMLLLLGIPALAAANGEGAGYTVDYYYGNEVFHQKGGTTIQLSRVLQDLDVGVQAENLSGVSMDNEQLVAVEPAANDWNLISLKPFSTDQQLTLTLKNGQELCILVKDAPEGEVLNSPSGGLKVAYITTANAKYYLSADANSYSNLTISAAGVVIDLNGHTLNMGDYRIIVNAGASLTIVDADPSAVHKGKISTYGCWFPSTDGTVPLSGGIICNNNGGKSSGFTVTGTLNFNAGTIAGFYSSASSITSLSAPIFVDGGTVNMNGGEIKHTYSNSNTGGVYIRNGGSVNMTAGSITNGKGGKAGAVYIDGNGTFTIDGGAYIDNCEKKSAPTGTMAYANGSSATVNVKGESHIGNCNTFTGNGGNVVVENGAKLNIDKVQSFTHKITSRSISLANLFTALQGQTSESGEATFNYSVTSVTSVSPRDSGITYDPNTGLITATDLSGTKNILINCGSEKFMIRLTVDVPCINYAVNGRNTKLSAILAAGGSSRSVSDVKAVDVLGDSLLTASQIIGDWNIHVNKTASDLSDEWGSVVKNLFAGNKTLSVSFNDDTEVFLNLTSDNLLNYFGENSYFFGVNKNDETIDNILSAIKNNEKYKGEDVVNVESTETDLISVINPSGGDPWKLKVVQRYSGGSWVWVLVEMDDGHEIVLNIQAPRPGEVFFESIPGVQVNWQQWWDLGNGWTHSHSNSYWFVRSMDSYEGQISYCIQPDWPQNEWNYYSGVSENYWEDVYDNRTIYDTNTIRILLGRVLTTGYKGNISYDWRYLESQNDSVMAQNMAEAIATQMLVWEVIVGQRDGNFNHVYPEGAYGSLLECLDPYGMLYGRIVEAYNRFEKNVQDLSKLPSFMADNEENAPAYAMKKVGSNYVLTLTDANNVLNRYTFTTDKNDVTITIEGNKLTLTTPTKYDLIKLAAEANVGVERYKFVVWHSNTLQDTASYVLDFETDKINGYARAINVFTGDLGVTKVLGGGTTTDKAFEFTLEIDDIAMAADFTDDSYMQDAIYTGATVNSKTAHKITFTFTLKGGETKNFKNFIPEGAKVTLTEINHPNYSVTMDANGTISAADTGFFEMTRQGGTFTVTNTDIDVGDLIVKKVVTGKSTDASFPMTLTITDISGKFDFTDEEFYSRATIPETVTRTAVSTSSITFSFSLKNGESIEIKNLVPDGASVTVTETSSGEFTPTIKVGTTSTEGTTHTFTVSGTGTTEVEVDNHLKAASLTIVKTVTGSLGDRKKLFNFDVEYTDVNGQNQKETVQLASGNSKTIEIQPGSDVKITEKDAMDYITTYTVNGATVAEGKLCALDDLFGDTTVDFVNEKEYEPETGIDLDGAPFALILCLAAIYFAWMLLHKRVLG